MYVYKAMRDGGVYLGYHSRALLIESDEWEEAPSCCNRQRRLSTYPCIHSPEQDYR